ncbi:branched-chain amino acid transport system II carrier protein [Evansella sp. AB-rgal1]|uniref:branched-chain amino acid transport system II carrier protein n=1 Tax=Evansella sp. AB-rgal1 TaxID=3242696 RepID=UPI00359E9B41
MRVFSSKDTITIGLMMFALFLGAGNLIFPPSLGQAAGTSVLFATIGFLVTGVGLPILAIIAIAKTGGTLQTVSERVGPIFSVIFPLSVYLAIGPLFGIPRTGSVAYEIGLLPYLETPSRLTLFLFTVCFFGISYWLSLNPSKLVGRIGKVLTPILVAVLAVLTVTGILNPMGSPNPPLTAYSDFPFFTGFQEGYFTMDAIAALVFGIIVISRLKERGVTTPSELVKRATQISFIAGTGLVFVYLSLAYLGATSVNIIGYQENGGTILSGISQQLLGSKGLILLSVIITIACLTTSVGLIAAFGEYIQRSMPKVPYELTTGIIALFSFFMANMGLTQLIQFSIPMLFMIYPIAIVLILYTQFGDFGKDSNIYKGSVIGAAIVSIPDGLSQTVVFSETFLPFLQFLPFSNIGLAWLTPALFGGVIGYFSRSTVK